MKRSVSFIILLTVSLMFACNADEVWKNANRQISQSGASIFHLVSADATSTGTVRVTFSRDVDIASGENIANYSIPGLTVTGAARDGIDYTVVNLTTTLHSDDIYTLTVTGVIDTSDNLIGTPNSLQFAGDVPPIIDSVSSINNTTVVVSFSEPVDEASAENSLNYITVPALTISSAERDSIDFSKVTLTTSSQTAAQVYQLTINSVTDLNGNPLDPPIFKNFTGTGANDFHLLSVAASSTNTVRVTFNQDVDITSGQNAANYSIPGLTITGAVRDGADHTVINLTTSTHDDINYTLTVTGVTDTSFNLIGSPNSLQFAGDVAPMIRRVSSTGNTTVMIYFTEPVDVATAENRLNYTTAPALTISSAQQYPADSTRVTLNTVSQTDGQSYKLTINNVEDLTGNTIASPNYEYFTGQGSGGGDTTDPVVLFAELFDSNTVEVFFSEPMNAATANVPGNYTIRDSDGTIIGVTTASTQVDASRVRLDIAGNFTSHLYALTVSTSLTDLNGNPLQNSPKNRASFAGEGSMPDDFSDGPVIVDPMDESSNSFSLLAKYRGRVYIGPSNSDNAIFRLKPDGSDAEVVTFYFHGETGDSTTLDPGPNGESGIDYIASGLIGGEEHLFFGPQKDSGNLNYIYYTSDTGSQIDFTYIDVNAYTSGPTRSINSMAVFNDMLFIGLSDQGPLNPILPKLINLVNNPVTDVDILGMEAPYFTRIGGAATFHPNTAGTVGIDIIYPFNNVLYIANGGHNAVNQDGGIVRSINNNPDDWSSGDWTDITPTGLASWYNSPSDDFFSIELGTQYKLIPADRAFPAMAAFNGNLYIARNTEKGPQLWKHDGVATWTLIADDDADNISELGAGYSDNASITMLIANDTWLYVGFDNSNNGLQIFRTNAANPLVAADFSVITNNGFGQGSDVTTIYHALSIEDNGTHYLWVLCGKDGNELRVYRASN